MTSDMDFVQLDSEIFNSTKSDFSNALYLTARVMRCDLVKDAAYAEGVECEDLPQTDWYFAHNTRAISTNFDPKFYEKYGTY